MFVLDSVSGNNALFVEISLPSSSLLMRHLLSLADKIKGGTHKSVEVLESCQKERLLGVLDFLSTQATRKQKDLESCCSYD